MLLSDQKLHALLTKHELITPEVWEEVAGEAKRLNVAALDILFSRRLLDREYFFSLLSKELGVERIILRKIDIPVSTLELIPEKIANDRKLVPFEVTPEAIKVAMVNPHDLESISLVSQLTNRKVISYLATQEEVQYALTNYQKIYREKYQKIIEQEVQATGVNSEDDENAVSRIIESLLGYAVGMNASDIHLEALEEVSIVRFRVDGVLRETMRFPKRLHAALIAKVKVLANLQLDEHFRPQDGRIKLKLHELMFDIRVALMPTLHGEKAALRLLATQNRPIGFDGLGINQYVKEILERSVSRTYGMLLITGPTGSGKTTTLYTILQSLNRPEVNICTIEDPIEYELPRVNQTQINPKVDLTFATGLRSFLRQDPNVIMVGEIRDQDTADIAVQAALTGHLLLSTLHTNDAPSSIPRILDLNVPPYLVAATLNVILAQRLVRKICLDCISSEPITTIQKKLIMQQLKNSGMPDETIKEIKLPEYLYRGKGCSLCGNSGYRGRIGIYEAVEVNEGVRDVLSKPNFNLSTFRNYIRSENGFRTMFEDGLDKVGLGTTTLEEVLRVIKD